MGCRRMLGVEDRVGNPRVGIRLLRHIVMIS